MKFSSNFCFDKFKTQTSMLLHILYIQVALLIILLQDQWKKAKEANAKKAKEPTKKPKEAHD